MSLLIPSPKISVIISTYNSSKFIIGKLDDLINQSMFDQIEIIIIDSGSMENEGELVKPYLEKFQNINYVRTENRETIYTAWNRGIKLAKGKFITNSNTDDRLKTNAFEILYNELSSKSKLGLVFGDQYISTTINENFDDYKDNQVRSRTDFSRLKLFWRYMIGSQSMWKADIHFKDNIWFDESFEIAGDYDFVLNIAEKYNIKRVPKVLGLYYRSGKNENKEFINNQKTIDETFRTQRVHFSSYYLKLTKKQKIKLNFIIEFYSRTPQFLYSFFLKVYSSLFHKKELPSKIFFVWLAAVIKNIEGNLSSAKSILDGSKNKSVYLIKKELEYYKIE